MELLLLVGGGADGDRLLADVCRLVAADVSVTLVGMYDVRNRVPDLPETAEVHAMSPAAQAHGPAFRRSVRRADASERFWLHVFQDPWVDSRAADASVLVGYGEVTHSAAQRLAQRHHGLRLANGIDEAIGLMRSDADAGAGSRGTERSGSPASFGGARVGPARRPGWGAMLLAGVRRTPDSRRYETARGDALRLLEAGRDEEADRLVRDALPRLPDPRLRADLLGDLVSWSLARGGQPALARDAYAAELAVADEHLAAGRHREAAESFEEAMRTAFHRALHFDNVTSPLADDPAGFTAPLPESATARAVRTSAGRAQPPSAGGSPTRLLIATWNNASYLGELREHFGSHPDFDTSFAMLGEVPELRRYAKNQARLVEDVLSGNPALEKTVESALRPYLDAADVVFIDWCTALPALVSRIDPGRSRLVVRLHSYEAFKEWPHLTDLSRIDDFVFVSDHLRDLGLAAIPGLQGAHAPRIHVIANAMELQPFRLPKTEDARFHVGVIGASKVVKDPRWAIDVLRRLQRHDERYRLLLLRGVLEDHAPGAREYAAELRRDLAELEPTGAVRVLSHTDDVPAALQDIGVVLSSSVRESFHMGIAEGAASGAVPVVRDWPYFPGAARRLFPEEWVVDDPAAAAERILAVTSSDSAWRAAGTDSASYVLDRWDWPIVRRDFERLLRA